MPLILAFVKLLMPPILGFISAHQNSISPASKTSKITVVQKNTAIFAKENILLMSNDLAAIGSLQITLDVQTNTK